MAARQRPQLVMSPGELLVAVPGVQEFAADVSGNYSVRQ